MSLAGWDAEVSLFMREWIEMIHFIRDKTLLIVSLFMREWIEILATLLLKTFLVSLSL